MEINVSSYFAEALQRGIYGCYWISVESAAISIIRGLPEYLTYFAQAPMYLDTYCAFQTQRFTPFSHLWCFPRVHFLVLHLYNFLHMILILFPVTSILRIAPNNFFYCHCFYTFQMYDLSYYISPPCTELSLSQAIMQN